MWRWLRYWLLTYPSHKIIVFCNRRWVQGRWERLLKAHCWISGDRHFCQFCMLVPCIYCDRIYRGPANAKEAGWIHVPEKGFTCPACQNAIGTALGWTPIQPTVGPGVQVTIRNLSDQENKAEVRFHGHRN